MYIYIYTNSLLNCMYKIDIETRTSCHLLPLHRTWPLHTAPSFEEILGRSRPGSRSLQKQLALECRRMRRPITGSIAASVQRAGHFSPESPLTILHNCSCFDSVIWVWELPEWLQFAFHMPSVKIWTGGSHCSRALHLARGRPLSLSLSNQKGVDMKRDSSKNHGIKCLAHIFKQRSIYIFFFIYLSIYLFTIYLAKSCTQCGRMNMDALKTRTPETRWWHCKTAHPLGHSDSAILFETCRNCPPLCLASSASQSQGSQHMASIAFKER